MPRRVRHYWIDLLDGPAKGEPTLVTQTKRPGALITVRTRGANPRQADVHEYRVIEGGTGKSGDPWRATWIRHVETRDLPPLHSTP